MNSGDIVCEYCNRSFKRAYEKSRHRLCCKRRESDNDTPRHTCESCEKAFSRKDALVRHVASCRGPSLKRKEWEPNTGIRRKLIRLSDDREDAARTANDSPRCEFCDVQVSDYYAHIKSLEHLNKLRQVPDENVDIVGSIFDSRIITCRVYPKSLCLTVKELMNCIKSQIVKLIARKQTEIGKSLKINIALVVDYIKDCVETESLRKSFTTENRTVMLVDDLGEVYNTFARQTEALSDEFQACGSGWAVEKMLYVDVDIYKYSPLKGSSYLRLPSFILKKKACINVENKDQACFFWAVMSALYKPKSHPGRVTSYPHYSKKLRTDNISLPVTLNGIKKFEKQNDISINVYAIEDKVISGPLYYRNKKREIHVNLLLIENKEVTHYCWIKDLSKLIARQTTKHTSKRWLCDGCFTFFSSSTKLTEHQSDDCSKVKAIVPTPEESELKFRNYENQLRVPVVVYADFESVLRPMSVCSPDPDGGPFTLAYQLHEAFSCGFYIKCLYDDSVNRYVKSRPESFIEQLEKELIFFSEYIKRDARPLNQRQSLAFSSATECFICRKPLGSDRVKDHCHLTGDYRGAAHRECNLRYKINKVVPIVVHNLAKYDAHFIIRSLKNQNVNLIAKNKEHYVSFTVTSTKLTFRFIDSYAFLSCGLDKLTSDLDDAQFNITKKEFAGKNVNLVKKKGVFPYDYIDNLERLNETSLPSRECFYNKLNKREITEDEYRHAENVWREFGVKTLGEYSDLYLKTDVLLLADVFENFRILCLETYELDPAHYVTAAGLAWDAMLKYTGVNMQLLVEMDMIKFIKKAIRGGLCQCNVKYSKANNKYMCDYNSDAKSKYIMYFDANNQYGWAMTQFLPIKNFQWLKSSEAKNLDVMEIEEKSETGYILEVDLEYPLELQDLHNDLPFCPEHKTTESNNVAKLITSLTDKKRYIIHYIHLQQVIRNGLKLKEIHRVLSFTQSQWLRPYIEFNTRKRIESKNKFQQNFYKLMNNSVYGKTIENVERRVNVRFVNRWESVGNLLGARALIARPNFQSCAILTDNICIIQMRKTSIKYDKPIYVGFSILELSKTLMYRFHYDYMKRKYNDDIRLMYTDTDSFVYEIDTDDFYDDIRNDLHEFDTSDYAKDNPYKLPLVNKKILGKFKDEYAGAIIEEFIGVRAKCYYIKGVDNATGKSKEIKKAKGIKTDVVKTNVNRDDYYNTVSKGEKQYREMNAICSRLHEVYSVTKRKLALNNNDDKRFAIQDTFYTLAWGHRDAGKSPFI